MIKIKRALISVSDKTGVLTFAKFLVDKNVEIISTGGTAKLLIDNGIEITPIEKVTGNPEAFGGRMKTISFQIESALLFRRDNDQDVAQAKELGIVAIDLVVCNLYPFQEVARQQSDIDTLIENIDIGGPTMIRAAAKNYKSILVATDPSQYKSIMSEDYTEEFSRNLALQAFRHTALYDGFITNTLEKRFEDENFTASFSTKQGQELRYGENPHQKAYVVSDGISESLAQVVPLQGKALSYNNYLDADAAFRCNNDINEFSHPDFKNCVTIIKHANPCGCALASNPLDALELAWNGDPISSFGSIICFNHPVNLEQANWLSDKFVEVLIAPSFSTEAKEVFARKKNLRLLNLKPGHSQKEYMVRTISGGLVVQEEDSIFSENWESSTSQKMNETHIELAKFGQRVAKHLKSNAIALVSSSDKGFFLAGAGMGNPNRLISLEQSINKAKENKLTNFEDMVLISDAFFPFRDNIDLAHSFGIKNILQPGGSIKDSEVVQACDEYGIAMMFSKQRHFRH